MIKPEQALVEIDGETVVITAVSPSASGWGLLEAYVNELVVRDTRVWNPSLQRFETVPKIPG